AGGPQPNAPAPLLAQRLALLGRLDAVIDRVAQQVHQRVRQLLDDQLVELDISARDLEVDLLAALAQEPAHQAREAIEDLPERHHAHLEDALLQIVELALE